MPSRKSKIETLPVMRWTFNNTSQCWNCQNCVGESNPVSSTDIARELEPHRMYEHEGLVSEAFLFILPECRLCDTYMTFVDHTRCPGFKRRKDDD